MQNNGYLMKYRRLIDDILYTDIRPMNLETSSGVKTSNFLETNMGGWDYGSRNESNVHIAQ